MYKARPGLRWWDNLELIRNEIVTATTGRSKRKHNKTNDVSPEKCDSKVIEITSL